MNDIESLTVKEAANLLQTSEQTVRTWLRGKKIRSWKVFGEWRVSKEDCLNIAHKNDCLIMSEKDVATYLGINLKQVKELCDKRLMPFIFRKDEVVFSREDIDEWLKSFVKKLL